MRFVAREARRGRHYDGILLDPPKYGRGPKGERWRIESDLMPMLHACRELLSDTPLFLLLTIYAIAPHHKRRILPYRKPLPGWGGMSVPASLSALRRRITHGDLRANFARWHAL